MEITFLLVPVLMSLTASQVIQSTVKNMKYKTRPNCKIRVGHSMKELTAGSLMICVTKCTTTSGCISTAWNRNTSVCMLSASDTIFEVDSAYSDYEQADGWTCASLVRFPVFRALNSTYATNRYEMSFTRASERCSELGTSLADPINLTTAQSMGLSYCSCGWMSDGNNAILLDYYTPACFSIFNTGPINCGFTLADAWCLMP